MFWFVCSFRKSITKETRLHNKKYDLTKSEWENFQQTEFKKFNVYEKETHIWIWIFYFILELWRNRYEVVKIKVVKIKSLETKILNYPVCFAN